MERSGPCCVTMAEHGDSGFFEMHVVAEFPGSSHNKIPSMEIQHSISKRLDETVSLNELGGAAILAEPVNVVNAAVGVHLLKEQSSKLSPMPASGDQEPNWVLLPQTGSFSRGMNLQLFRTELHD